MLRYLNIGSDSPSPSRLRRATSPRGRGKGGSLPHAEPLEDAAGDVLPDGGAGDLSQGIQGPFDVGEEQVRGDPHLQPLLGTEKVLPGTGDGLHLAGVGQEGFPLTAGAGENNAAVRSLIGQYIGYLGTNIDPEKNKVRGEEIILSDPDAKVVTMVVPTNEELSIARQTVAVIQK